MSATAEFYLARAAESAKAAAETNLANVRERSLRAQAAWQQMAERILQTEQNKRKHAEDKAASDVTAVEAPWPLTPIRPKQPPRR